MTGLYDHRYFIQRLQEEMVRADRHKHSMALLMIDLDNFKHFNDTYGHLMGDTLLRKSANVSKTTFEPLIFRPAMPVMSSW